MANYNEILKHWKETNAEEMEELQFWLDEFITEDADTPEELALQLTAYEQWGCIDFDKWLNDQIKNKLGELDDSELVALHNEGCDRYNYYDDYIYNDLAEMLEGLDVEQAVNRVYYGEYQGNTIGYFKFNGYANVVEDCPQYLIDEDLCVKMLREQMPELSDDAERVLLLMALHLVAEGY